MKYRRTGNVSVLFEQDERKRKKAPRVGHPLKQYALSEIDTTTSSFLDCVLGCVHRKKDKDQTSICTTVSL